MREGGGADDPPRARASRARRSTTNPDRGRNRRGLREESDLRAASGGPGSGGRDRRGLESGTGAKGKVEKYLGAAAAAGRGGGEAKGKGGGRKGDGGRGDDDGVAWRIFFVLFCFGRILINFAAAECGGVGLGLPHGILIHTAPGVFSSQNFLISVFVFIW